MSRRQKKGMIEENIDRRWKAGGYVRLSVEDKRKKENNSVGTQRGVIEKYLEEKTDIMLYRMYEDVNVSGTSFERPAFAQMMQDLDEGKINCVIIKDLSRFGRNYLETGRYLEEKLPSRGTRLISITDHYDTLTATSVDTGLLVPLKNIMNEVYARDISRKVRSQYAIKRKKGEFCGAFAPYGYTKEGSHLVPDAETAKIVQRIFHMVEAGMSDTAIVQVLNQEEIPSPSQYRYENGFVKADKFKNCKYWYRSAIKRITENPAYVGRLAQGRCTTGLFQPGGRPVAVPEDEWTVVENVHPAIISVDLYETVQQIRKRRKKEYSSTLEQSDRPESSENLLKGLVICGNCKSGAIRHKLVRSNGEVEYCYLCCRYEEVDKHSCVKLNFPESVLMEVIRNTVEIQLELSEKIRDWIKKDTGIQNEKKRLQEMRNKLNKQKLQILKSVEGLEADLKDGLITDEDQIFFLAEYQAEIEKIDRNMEQLECAAKEIDFTNNAWVKETGLFHGKKIDVEMIAALIQKIELYPNQSVNIVFNFQDELKKVIDKMEGDGNEL